ncbi:MAG TPA: CRISPR-associated ring nuclease [Roseiflexaceae bacterium]|nr:CRISPR-associated ring nuclease [Roseiflexaceae bacterium]
MGSIPGQLCVATLGRQPQVVTLALDALLARGYPIDELVVVHLSEQTPRYRAALAALAREFAGERYTGRRIRYRPWPVRLAGAPVQDLHDDHYADAAQTTFHQLFQYLKRQDALIHLCPSGGRRLLGMLALAAAQIWLDQTDRVWHLYSTDEVREQTRDGALLHLGAHPGVQLVRVPLLPLGSLMPGLRDAGFAPVSPDQQSRMVDQVEHERCHTVWEQLSEREREVLRAFAQGLTPQQVAEELHISTKTVDSHKTVIFQLCRNAWGLAANEHLSYRWLRDRFRSYLRV